MVSSLDGKPLDANAMQSMRNSKQGCYFSIQAGLGAIRVIGLRGNKLPFELPPLTIDPATGKANGREIGLTVRDPDIPVPIDIDCWVPSSMTINDLAAAITGVTWEKIYQRLRKARIITEEELARPVSREMREYQHESLEYPVPPLRLGAKTAGPKGKGQHSVSPDDGVAYSDPYIWTIECSEPVWLIEFEAYYFECTITRTQVMGGVTVTAKRTPPPDPTITTRTAAIAEIEYDWCGFLGCSGDGVPPQNSGDPLDLQINAYFEGNDSTVGQMVHFSVQTPWIQPPEGTEINWSWQSNDEDDQTMVDYTCYTSINCSFRVYSEGRAEVTVQTPTAYGLAYKRIEFSVEPCTGSDPDLVDKNKVRNEYKNGYTMPPCEEIRYQPTGTIVGWPQIKDHGPEPHSHAIYKQSVDNGLVALNQLATVTILSPTHRIYSTPSHQYFINSAAPNSRHIYGDAADMRALTKADWDDIETKARSLTPRPCREPWNPNKPHLHIDYRNQPGAIRLIAGNCPNLW